MDKLRTLTLFCRTVEAGSFAAAAHAAEMVPSALSKAIAALERDLGFRLMHRSTRKLSLTEEGSAYYQQCRALLQGLDEAEVIARLGRAGARGTLRVGLHPALRLDVFTQCGRLLDAHPGLKLETVITNTPGAVLEEGLDVVLRIGKLPDSGLVSRQLGWTRSIVCAAPSYIASRGEPRHPRDLSQHRAAIYARRDEEPNTRWQFKRGAERYVAEVPVGFIARDGIGLADAVVGGCGIARPFHFAVRSRLASGQLLAVLPDWAGERHAVYAVLPQPTSQMPAKAGVFLDFIRDVIRE
jgi:DNA-binding transcriptional LysR family regulator